MIFSRPSAVSLEPAPLQRAAPDVFAIVRSAYEQMMNYLTAGPPERGLFGVALRDGIVRHMYADCSACCSGVTYSPNVDVLNAIWREQFGTTYIIPAHPHSHPGAFGDLSRGDLEYADRILQANPQVPYLYIPIVTLVPAPQLHPHVVERRAGGGVVSRRVPLRIYDEVLTPAEAPVAAAPVPIWRRLTARLPRRRPWWEREAFARVCDAYDLELLAHSRAVVLGCGAGGMRLTVDLHRAGLGSSVVIDPDRVGLENLATQAVTRRDVGRAKVEACRRAARAINPHARVRAVRKRVEAITDEAFAALCGLQERTPPRRTLVVATTDSFAAQARAARLALQFGLPLLAVQLYAHGSGGEIVFVEPTRSRACHRCLLAPRYAAYADGYRNTVTAAGSPLSSTAAVSALALRVALMLLHHGSGHRRWRLEAVAERNLVQLRLDPDVALPHFDRLSAAMPEAHCGEPLWLAVPPVPGCPDCGGHGRIGERRGAWTDTRTE